MKTRCYTTIILVLFTVISMAQPPGPPPQDCINAIPVCQNTYSFPMGFMGQGMNPNEINPTNSCLPNGEKNDMWFRFRALTGGKLRFTITPNTPTDNYDWALFNLTGKACSDIFNGNLEVACNASANVTGSGGNANGRTGANSNPPFFGDLGFVFPSFIGDITVNTGDVYVLNISNFSGGMGGFSIDFSASSAVLFNPATPAFQFVKPVICGDDHLIVHFNKPIQCDSVQPSDFLLAGYTITNVSSLDCNTLNKKSSPVFRLDLNTPIINSGSFALNLIGSIVDDCGFSNSSDAVTFNVSDVKAGAGEDFIFCKGDNINIQIGDTNKVHPNVTYQWTSTNPLVQAALSNSNAPIPTLIMLDIPADTVQMILTATTGNCIDQDTMMLYFRDCCKNYDAGITTFTNVGCFGASTGEATATATGSISGVPAGAFTYQWSNGNNTFLASGLSANINYTVIVTDPLGCIDSATITLSQPNSPISTSSTGDILACFGDSTGVIDLTVGGATPPYNYLWSNGDTTQDLTGLLAGNYTVTVTDANNCTITQSEQVTQPPTPIVITGSGNTIACGATTGNININVNGGGTPYQYHWSNNSTTQNISNIIAGTYTVSVTDAFGCQVTQDFTINTLTNLTATTTSTDAACTSSPTGSATAIPTGGLAPYSYQWSNNQTTATISNLNIGLYTVTVTDATNCAIVASATVGENSTLSIQGTSIDVSCHNGNDGSIQTSITSNTVGTYTYQWSGTTQTTANINNLSTGNYTVTVTDQNGCTANEAFTINQPSALSITANGIDVSCFGGNDGVLNATATGGTAPYTYQWSNGLGILPNISGVPVGNYSVTVTDAKGCTANATASVGQPNPLFASLTPTVIACAGTATGLISVNTTGGNAPYSYSWNNTSIGNTPNPTNLSVGNYSVTVTDANGCTFTENTTINALPAISISPTPVHVNCFGANTGGILLNINNASQPYTFNWSGGIGNIQNPANLGAGNYSVTLTDANGCTASTSTTITQPNSPLIAFTQNDTLDCNGNVNGSLQLNVSGGTPSYSFNWDNGIGAIQNPSNLGVGNYNVTITDANGCSTNTSAQVIAPAALTASAVSSNITCFGGTNAVAAVNVSGGTIPYSYQWSGTTQTTPSVSGLSAGTHTVTVTDANNCTITASTTVNQPAQLQISLMPTDVSCFGGNDGSILAIPSGGTIPYSYQWSDASIGNISNPTNLSAGSYTVTITDAYGCNTTLSTTISTPTALQFSTSVITPATCNQNNGTIVVNASNGTPNYNYNWSSNAGVSGNTNTATNLGSGNYSVTVLDANGCSDTISNIYFAPHPAFQLTTNIIQPQCQNNSGSIQINSNQSYNYQWSPNASTGNSNIAQNLSAGNYTLTISDATNCDTVLNFTINSSPTVTSTEQVTNAYCGQTNGTISIQVQTGTAPYHYNWNITPNPGNVATVNNLNPGNYQLTITDANGCLEQRVIVVNGSPALNIQPSVTQPNCIQGGKIEVTPNQGTAPYHYNWSNNANTGNIPQANNLGNGTYTVTITDDVGCQDDFSFTLFNDNEFDILIDNLGDNECPNAANGFIDISTTSTATTLNYQWSNAATTEDINNLVGGTYTVTVTDPITGCTDIEVFNIQTPDSLIVDVPDDVVITAGDIIDLTASSNLINTIFSWAGANGSIVAGPIITVSPEQTSVYTLSAQLPNCPPQTYQVTVTVQRDGDILIPEAFTPNGDGLNDEFSIYPRAGIEILSFQIFNRWGERMHLSDGSSITPWDGTYRDIEMPNDSYIYVIEYALNGEELTPKRGQFLLIR
jgi:gliding motility-associated-like protein